MTPDQWRQATRVVSDAMLLVGPEGRIVAVNPATVAMIPGIEEGAELKDVLGDSPAAVDHALGQFAATHEPVLAGVTQFRGGGSARLWGSRVSGYDGGPGWLLNIRLLPRESEDTSTAVTAASFDRLTEQVDSLSREVQRRRQVETALRRSEERFRAAFHSTLTGMSMESLRPGDIGRILRANDSLCHLLDRPELEVVGSSALDFVHPEDLAETREALVALSHGEINSWQGEERYVRPDGTVVWALVRKARMFNDGDDSYTVTQVEDITGRKEAEARLTHLALHDLLTGLPNRALLVDRLGLAVSRARRDGTYFAVLYLDLDDFKVVNDSLGHTAGDELLVAVAERLQHAARDTDTAARLGGDEFVLLCEGLDEPAGAEVVAHRVLEALGQKVVVHGYTVVPQASIGISVGTPDHKAEPEALLREADAAMYAAKGSGKNRPAIYNDSLRTASLRRLDVEAALRTAIVDNELRLVFQPVVDLDSGTVRGAEALVRWQHPARGLLAPVDFLDVAEATGLIVPLGAWVLRNAAAQAEQWTQSMSGAEGPGLPHTVAVNVSVRQLADPTLRGTLERLLDESVVTPDMIQLEITESQYMAASETMLSELAALRALGFTLSLDDFGTGYSSLSYIKHFPFDVVKLDRSYVGGLGRDRGDDAIVTAVLALAQALDLDTVAEGVETEEQARLLLDMGCHRAQGYYFGHPTAPSDISREPVQAGWPATR